VLTARGRLPVEEAAEYLLQALEALGEAHALGIVHRDLKPGNLFVTRRRDDTPVVKVLDFGISKVLSGTLAPLNPLTQVSALMGSPMYMSPEQMKASRDIDARADLWAVGVILYELLTGDVPFKGESLPELCAMIVLDGEVPRARELAPDVPAALDAVIARCLARKPDDRFANAAELARALAPFAPERARVSVARVTASLAPLLKSSQPGTPAVTESATNATWSGAASQRRPRKSSWWWLAAAVLGALAAVGLSLASKVHSGRAEAASGVPGATVEAATAVAPPAVAPPAAAAVAPPAVPVVSLPEVPANPPRAAALPSAAPTLRASASPSVAPPRSSAATPRGTTPPKPATSDPLPFGGRR
jgi:serine/threonine-protein kinase